MLASKDGVYKAAKKMFASKGGAWVEVPMGGGAPEWTRPADWLPTSVTPGEQKVQFLVSVLPAPNEPGRVVTVHCQGSYTVDWGDGTAPENVNSNIVAYHAYAPSALAGSETSEGWQQALVTVTPQSGNLTYINFTTAYYAGKNWSSPVVEVVVGPGTLTTFNVANLRNLRRVEFLSPMSLGGSGLFSGCSNLIEVIGSLTITSTASNAFGSCYNLRKLPNPLILGPAVTSMASMFLNCFALTEVPWMDTSNVVAFNSTFSGCSGVVEFPDYDTSDGTNFSSMFSGCYRMQRAPALNTSSGTTFTSMFTACYRMDEVPATLATGNGTMFNSMFQNCSSMEEAPLLDLHLATNVSSMFNSCSALAVIPGDLDLSQVPSAANIATIFTNCTALRRLKFAAGKGPRYSWTVMGMLDAAQLNDIYTQLPTVTGQTFTVGSTVGTDADNPAIATAKGWTVA